MRQQMERVEADLVRSKELREKQGRELRRQLDDERRRHEQQVGRPNLTRCAVCTTEKKCRDCSRSTVVETS